MNILKFIKSFNTVNCYLIITSMLLMGLILYFYVVHPV
ncbi:hypothetical protein [Acinetobacter sp. WZC-1]